MKPTLFFKMTLPLAACALLAGLLLAIPTQAATVFWDGADTTGNGLVDGGFGTWDTTSLNWTTISGMPNFAWTNANNDTAWFTNTAGTVTLGEPITANALVISGAYTIANGGYNLTLNGTGLTIAGNNTATLSGTGTLMLGASQTWTNNTATMTIASPVNTGGNLLTLETGNNAMDVTGIISGNGGLLVKSSQTSATSAANSGNPTLNNANDYTGTTTLMGGYIWLNSGGLGALGADTSDIILNAGGFRLTGSGTVTRGLNLTGSCGVSKVSGTTTFNGRLSGTGGFSVSGNFGAGTFVILAGSNDFTGELSSILDVTLRLGHPYAASMASVNTSGTRSFIDCTNANLGYVMGGIRGTNSLNLGTGLGGGGSGAVSFGNNNQNNVYPGALSGAAGFTKIGTGTQAFVGTNIYTGDTTINTGRLKLGVPTQTLSFTLAGTTTALRRVFTGLASTADLFIGQAVSGAGIAANTVIVTVDSATQVSVNNAATTGTTSASFAGRSGAIAGSTNIIVANSALFDVANVSGGFALGASQTLKGNGTVLGNLSVANNSIVSPGASVGTLTNVGNVSWAGGGTLRWEINSTGAGGQDLLNIAGVLTNLAASSSKFKINVVSLDGSGAPGALAGGFNPNADQSWKMATASGGVLGVTSDAFAFQDNFTAYNGGTGTFVVTNIGNDVLLVYKTAFVAEPPTAGTPNPATATAWIGESVNFTISPSGTGPLSYQWRHSGTNLDGETATSLRLTNIQPSQAGNYDCVVSSPYPPASSSSVAVVVVNRFVVNAQYRMGEDGVGSNNRPKDSSGYAHDFNGDTGGGNVVVSADNPAPHSTNCYAFNGTSGFSGIGWDPPEDNVGVECWVRVGDLAQNGVEIFGTGRSGLNGLNITFASGIGLRAARSTSGFDQNFGAAYLPSSTDEWVHVAIVRAGGVNQFYINGIQSGGNDTGTPADATIPYMSWKLSGASFTGAVDEARIFTFAPGQFVVTDLGYYQGLGPVAKVHPKPYFQLPISHATYGNARDFVSYTGWWDLWYRYRGILPFGLGVNVAQVENNVPNTLAFPDKLFTLDPVGAGPATDGHAETVGRIYYGSPYYQDSRATFEYGFGSGVPKIAAYTTDAFRTDVLRASGNVRDGTLPAWNGAKREVLNISNSMGNGGEDNTIRALDYLLDVENVLGTTAYPGSYLGLDDTLAGNLWNSLVLAQNGPRTSNLNGAQYENVESGPGAYFFRSKPDMVSSDYIGGRTGGSSSWVCPTVASGAAFLLEAARATNITAQATNNYVLKSILMAGASKSGLVSPVWDGSGTTIIDWDLNTPYLYSNNPPSQPLDRLFGAGLFNINNAYTILTAGEQSHTATNQAIGWAKGTNLNSSAAQSYWFAVMKPKPEFVATLVWNRHIQDNAGFSYNWDVADLKLELYNASNQLLASSDDPGNNVEQVYVPAGLAPGAYYLKVSSYSTTNENYGLAWRTACPTAVPEGITCQPQGNGTMKVIFQGVPSQLYKLYQSTDLSSGVWTEVGAATSDVNGMVEMIDPAPPAAGAFYRAQFTY